MGVIKKEDVGISIKPTIFEGDVLEVSHTGNLIQLTTESLKKAFHVISTGAEMFYQSMKEMEGKESCPDNVTLEFGVQVDVKGSIFIAETAANSSFKVAFNWNPGKTGNDHN